MQGPRRPRCSPPTISTLHDMAFMAVRKLSLGGIGVHASRSGYTGEDGFELSVAAAGRRRSRRWLIESPLVRPVGSARATASASKPGLPLRSRHRDHHLAGRGPGLAWSIQKAPARGGRFSGRAHPPRPVRGARPAAHRSLAGRACPGPCEGTPIVATDGRAVGLVTLGWLRSPVGGPIAMGYVTREASAPGTALQRPCAASRCRRGLRRCPSSRIAISARWLP